MKREGQKEVKKILVLWGVVTVLTVATLLVFPRAGFYLLQRIHYPTGDDYLLSRALFLEGEKHYRAALQQGEDKEELAEAERLFVRALELLPKNHVIARYLGEVKEMQGERGWSHYYYGRYYLGEEEYEKAEDQFGLGLTYLPGEPQVQEKLAATYWQQDELNATTTTLAQLLEEHPDFAPAYYLRALTKLKSKEIKEAIQDLERCLELAPQHLDAAKLLGNLYADRGDFWRAEEIFEAAHEYAPRDANLLHIMGKVALRKGEVREALRYFKAAERIEKHSSSIYLDLARTYEQLGRSYWSEAMLQKAVRLDPELKERLLSGSE